MKKPSDVIADAVSERVKRQEKAGQSSRFLHAVDHWVAEILNFLDQQAQPRDLQMIRVLSTNYTFAVNARDIVKVDSTPTSHAVKDYATVARSKIHIDLGGRTEIYETVFTPEEILEQMAKA